MRAFVKGICFAAFAAFALGATGCGKEASCDSAADHVIGIMMKGAEDEIKKLPDGEDKKKAQEEFKKRAAEGKKEMKDGFVKKCKDEKWSKDCLSCVQG